MFVFTIKNTMYKVVKTVILNSLKNKQIKTPLGRWKTTTNEKTQKRAVRSSIDHCGVCFDKQIFQNKRKSK